MSVRSRPWITRAARAGLLAVVAVAAAGCNAKRVSRIDPNAVTDLSGRWNDADSRLVANALIEQSLTAPWQRQFSNANGGRNPTVMIGSFRNRSMELIPVQTFTRDLERAFVNSGQVSVVASKEERAEVRAERDDQQNNAAADARARQAMELGANFLLQGDVQSIEDSEGRERIIYYQVDATLISVETGQKIWIGQHRIKKYIERRRIGME